MLIYIYTEFQYILISVWLYVVSVQNAFKYYLICDFGVISLCYNKNKKPKHKLLQRGRKERERVKMMRGAYKKGMILTIR